MKFDPLLQLPNAWTGVAGRFGLHLFQGDLTVADMDRLDQVGQEWHGRNPGKVVELIIVFPSHARMTAEERARMSRLMKRWETKRLASGTVILAEGLVGSLHRSVLTGLLMVAPPPHPSKVFSSVKDAMVWLDPHLPRTGSRAPVGDSARARLEPSGWLAAVEAWCAEFAASRAKSRAR